MELMALAALPLLAFVAAFRGWGFWPFLLLALPFAPDLARATGAGVIAQSGQLGGLAMGTTLVGLGLMILVGREN